MEQTTPPELEAEERKRSRRRGEALIQEGVALLAGAGEGAAAARELREGAARLNAEADRLTAPAAVDLDVVAPTFASLYGVAQLDADRDRRMVSLATLPRWPGADAMGAGHGWGDDFNRRALAGGLAPGDFLVVGAAGAGVGKTAWLMQAADGLALRTAELAADKGTEADEPLTPVLVLTEMDPAALMRRTLARWTGCDANALRAGVRHATVGPGAARRAFGAARDVLDGKGGGGPLLPSALAFMRHWRAPDAGDVVAALVPVANRWRDELAEAHGRPVWPVVVVDPVQRWQDPTADDVRGLDTLAADLRAAATAHGWIVLATSDTNKPAAAGRKDAGTKNTADWAVGLFRGSQRLQHSATVALALTRPTVGEDLAPGLVGRVVKGPVGPAHGFAWTWETSCYRFTPATDAEVGRWTGTATTTTTTTTDGAAKGAKAAPAEPLPDSKAPWRNGV